MQIRGDLQLICYPRDDVAFQAEVLGLLDIHAPHAETEAELIPVVMEALRRRHPDVLIRSRDPIADYASGQVTWHVYRDGRPSGLEADPEGERGH
ncbi:MAG TPA: hypothetical protein VGQ64_08980 [Candidatus Limnocylindrales bacterium]|nr:hypothetical protein [Candidatus Limnocylindrales bacterium]